MFPQFLIGVAFVTFLFTLFRLKISRQKKPYKKKFEEYLERDRSSNLARKKEIPDELFVRPDISALPLKARTGDEYRRLNSRREDVVRASQKKMIRLDRRVDNIELKQEYGAASLDAITTWEDNYNAFLRALINYAGELSKLGEHGDAAAVLRESIAFGSDLSLSYTMLADAYSAMGRADMLDELLAQAEEGLKLCGPELIEKVREHILSKQRT